MTAGNRKQIFVALSFLLIVSGVQAVDEVMIATDITSVDALVAKAAAAKSGIPVLIAEDGLVSADVKEKISSLGVKKIIVVGGPAVVKPEAFSELQSLVTDTLRLWGVERTGTALEVAKFFWPDGASCSVLADDTKNPAADTELLAHASSLAAELNCMLIPVPAGTMPAEVIALLNELGVNETKIVARITPDVSQLGKFQLKIIQGDENEIEIEVENEIEIEIEREGVKPKIVIVAVSSFRDSLGTVSHPGNRSVARFVTDISELDGIIAEIKENGITDVRVVGAPQLTQQIASALVQRGIVPKQVSGSHREVSLKLMDEFELEWEGKRKDARIEETRISNVVKMRPHLLDVFNETENRLVELELEFEDITVGNPSAQVILDKVKESLDKLPLIRAKILASPDIEEAKTELFNALSSVEEARWVSKIEVEIEIEIEDEEEGLEDRTANIQQKISQLESRLARLAERCGSSVDIELFLSKVKSLKAEADSVIAAGDHARGAVLLSEIKTAAKIVHNMGEICEKKGRVEANLVNRAKGSVKAELPELEIESPQGAETVRGTTVEVKVNVKNFNLKPAGDPVKKGEGHLHYYLDSTEQVSPQTAVTFTDVTEGMHTIRVELHNNDHSLLTPPVAQSITIEQTLAAAGVGGGGGGGGY